MNRLYIVFIICFVSGFALDGYAKEETVKSVVAQPVIRPVKSRRNPLKAKMKNLELALKRVQQPAPPPSGAGVNAAAAAAADILVSDSDAPPLPPSDARSRLRLPPEKQAKKGS
jgi:hypothetical protein